MRYKLYWRLGLIFIIQLVFNAGFSQNYDCGNISIDSADQHYNVGRFDECIDGPNRCLQIKKAFNADQKVQALHILAKCYLAMDSISRADSVIEELLALKENFETYIIEDATRAIDANGFVKATEKILSSGGQIIKSEVLYRHL